MYVLTLDEKQLSMMFMMSVYLSQTATIGGVDFRLSSFDELILLIYLNVFGDRNLSIRIFMYLACLFTSLFSSSFFPFTISSMFLFDILYLPITLPLAGVADDAGWLPLFSFGFTGLFFSNHTDIH